MKRSVYVGFDPREVDGFAVTRSSIRRHCNMPIPIRGLVLSELRKAGLFWREQERRNGQIWDVISEAPCATEFSISRFLTPILAKGGLAMFVDSDVLFRGDVWKLFDSIDRSKAVSVVKHSFDPPEGVKMDGQAQTRYARKGWSAMAIFNADHPANEALTVDLVNTVPGRDLHAFNWLRDKDIGEIGVEWNWLSGISDPAIEPRMVHFTEGVPSMAGYESAPFADEWRAELARWAA